MFSEVGNRLVFHELTQADTTYTDNGLCELQMMWLYIT